ncbi:MAG: MBL fold metallo-hydrolase [Clostridia bacterium]|nr:MBL fold metallo-hydrolase [Clostridia bacterium]
MELLRTANAGILLTMDSTSILLDGVCPPYANYLGTPDGLRERLLQNPPDALVFTHRHPDHCDEDFADTFYKNTHRPILWAEDPCPMRIGNLEIIPIPTCHSGKAEIAHVSYVIKGSQCLWFTGDASPLARFPKELRRPDVAAVTFAYACRPNVWKRTKAMGAKKYILLHLPDEAEDSHQLWKAVEETTAGEPNLFIPSIGENIVL